MRSTLGNRVNPKPQVTRDLLAPSLPLKSVTSPSLQALDRLWNAGLFGTRAACEESGRALGATPKFRILLRLPGLCFGLTKLEGYIPFSLAQPQNKPETPISLSILKPSTRTPGERDYLGRNIPSLLAALSFIFWLVDV